MTNQVLDTKFTAPRHDDGRLDVRQESAREEVAELLAPIRDLIVEYNRLAKESPEMGGDAASRRNPSASVEAISNKLAELEDKILPMFGKALDNSYGASQALVEMVTNSRLKSEMTARFDEKTAERKNHSEGNDKVKDHVRNKFGMPASEASLRDSIEREANQRYKKQLEKRGLPSRKDPVDLLPEEKEEKITLEPAVDVLPASNDFLTASDVKTEEIVPESPVANSPLLTETPDLAEPAAPTTQSFFDSPKEDNPAPSLIPGEPKEEKIEPVAPDAIKPTEMLLDTPEVGPQIGVLPIERHELSGELAEGSVSRDAVPIPAQSIPVVPAEQPIVPAQSELTIDASAEPMDRRAAVKEWLDIHDLKGSQTTDKFSKIMPGISTRENQKTE